MGKSKNKCKTKDCENKTESRRKHYCPECSVAKKTKTTLVKCWSCKEAHPAIGKFCPLCGEPASGPANKEVMPSTESDVMSRVKRFPMDDVAAFTQQFESAKLDMSASADASSSTASSRPAEEQPGTLSDTSGNGGHQTLNQQSTNNISVQSSSGDNENATTSAEKSNKPSKEDHKKPDASGSSVEANSTKLSEKSHQPSESNSGKISNPDLVDSEPKPDKEGKHSTPVIVRSTRIAVPSEGSDMKSQSKEEVGMVNLAPPDGKTTNSDDIKSDAVHSEGEANFEIKFVDKEYGEKYGAGFLQQGVKEPTNKASGTAENERQESQVFGPSAPNSKSVGHAFGTKQESVVEANNTTAKDGMSPRVNNKTTEDHGTTKQQKIIDEEYEENYGTGFPQKGMKKPTNKASGTAEDERQESQAFGPSAPDPKSVGHAFDTKEESVDKANNSTAKDGMSPSVNNKTTEDHGTPPTDGGHKNQPSTNSNTTSNECSPGDNKNAAPAKGTHAAYAKGTQNENANSRQTGNNQSKTGTDGSSVDHDPLKKNPSYAQATGSQNVKPGECDNRRDGVKLVKDAFKGITDSNKNKNQHIPKVLIDGDAKEKMTVFFHVVVTPEFQFNQKTDKIVIRFSPPSFGNFGSDVVVMDYLRNENGFVFMEGKLPIKPSYLSYTNIQYKYVLKRSVGTGSPYYNYEWIHKGYSHSIINRLLRIPKEARKEQGIWHHFDGAIQIKETDKFRKPKTENKSFQGKLWSSLKNILHLGSDIQTKLLQDQMYAMLSYLPEWEGFICKQKGQTIGRETALEAIDRLCNVTDCMSNILVVPEWYRSGSSSDRWKPGQFSVEKVLQNYFHDKLKEIGRDEENCNQTMLSQRLVSGLAIALVDERFPFLEYETRRLILQSLVLPSDLKKMQYEKLIENIKNTFPGQHLRSIAGVLENLCNRAMNPRKMDLTFILVLPLLHFVRGESKPMEWPEALDKYTFDDYRWWGHNNLDVKAVKGKHIHQMEDFLPMLVKIQPLLSVDLLMQRTFLATLRSEALDILKDMKFDFLVECAFVGLSLIEKRSLYSADIGDLKLILPDLVKHGKEENTACGERCNVELHFRQRAGVVDVVQQTFKELISKTRDWKTLKQYLQLFSEALKQFEVHANGDKESTENTIIQRTHIVLTLTLEYFRTFDILHYMMVVNGFFIVTFTNEKANYLWNSGLHNFLVQRIDMLNLEDRISYYCNHDLSAFHLDIQKAFSDKAFQAINQVMKEPELFFNTFSYSSNSKTRIRALLSHFVNQSWDGKRVTLKMCLTWRALSGFFRQSDSISILNENAQTQVLTVKSKIEDATARLINGDLIVEDLRVLLEHKDHFLTLCEMIDVPQITRLCSQMKNVIGPRGIVSKILECRKIELTSFEDVRYRAGIFSHICCSLYRGEFFSHFE